MENVIQETFGQMTVRITKPRARAGPEGTISPYPEQKAGSVRL